MSFIGIVSESKVFENIKSKLVELAGENKFNIILINPKSIENIKNIKFDVIVIDSDLEKLSDKTEILSQMLQKTNYVLVNTDINKTINQFEKNKLITYGLNQKAMITISSITESDMLICIQQNIKSKNNIIEIEEKRLKLNEKCKLKTYEILILYAICLINNNIINEV